MFLATTALSEFWDQSGKIYFLGPWCTRYDQKDKWTSLDYQLLPNPCNDRIKYYQAGQYYCQRIFEHLLSELSIYLNDVHGVSYSNRYWRILLGPWLIHFVDAFHDRYYLIQEAF